MLKHKALNIILITILALFSAACGSKTDDAYIYFELTEAPLTLDAQTAESDAELLIVRNIYEGLMRKDENGKLCNAACEEYFKKGLTYTFTLRKNIKWSNGEAVTAADFVFGLRRALNPETNAPFASRLFAITNAREINAGNLTVDKLGVFAINDNTVKITLQYDDDSFLESLATSVAMPCNEEFFKQSKGKYGLFKEYIISNSSYRLAKWNKESFGIRLYKNEEYGGNHKAKNAAVFLTCDNTTQASQKLKENQVDISFIDPAQTDEMQANGFKTQGVENICWVMTASNTLSTEMRTALFSLVGGEIYGKSLKTGYREAFTVYPEICSSDLALIAMRGYDLNSGKALYGTEIKKLEDSKFPSDIKLIYYDNGYVKAAITDIVGHWQNNLSAFVNIESVDSADVLLPQLKSQTLPFAIFPVKATGTNAYEYTLNYSDGDITPNKLQEDIISAKNIIPLFFSETTLCYSNNIEKLSFTEDNGYIDFAFVIKKGD